jgi:hypothetical protein
MLLQKGNGFPQGGPGSENVVKDHDRLGGHHCPQGEGMGKIGRPLGTAAGFNLGFGLLNPLQPPGTTAQSREATKGLGHHLSLVEATLLQFAGMEGDGNDDLGRCLSNIPTPPRPNLVPQGLGHHLGTLELTGGDRPFQGTIIVTPAVDRDGQKSRFLGQLTRKVGINLAIAIPAKNSLGRSLT